MSSVAVVLASVVTIEAAMILALVLRRRRGRQAEGALRASEERHRLVVDRAPVMIWTARPNTTLDFLNHTCVEFTGKPIEQLLSNGWLDVVHPDDLDNCVNAYTPAIEARAPFIMEYRARRADGAYRWLLATGVPKYKPDGSYDGYVGCDIDITERKHAEETDRASKAALEASNLKIRQMAGQLIKSQDEERARVARDLHDDVSQQLAGLSIALSGIKRRMDELQVSDELKREVRSMHERAATLAQNVRHLSHDLHPTVLRHAGLPASLNSYCAELGRAHGTNLTCSVDGDIGSISPEASLCLYRIAQEALRNVIAHAGASRVEVRLLRAGDVASITIEDNGKGFDVAHSLDRGKGLGLVSITERARFVGGTVSVLAETNKGTRVHAQVPAHASLNGGSGSGGS